MANTYTQIYMHIIFAVNNREAMISDVWAEDLYRYLAAICQHRQHFVHAINGSSDHVHLLIGMHPTESVASLVKEMKGQSSRWINQKFHRGTFSWQSGYGAFSYSRSLVPAVKQYVENQHEHHRRVSFTEELEDIFRKAGIEVNPQYMMYGFDT
ncbi:MAG: IS200/IS605 family transposase [Bacteroidaceae bacterium]|nr:IS200/IS605 family transposase [Bacteroidaceae bacterium]